MKLIYLKEFNVKNIFLNFNLKELLEKLYKLRSQIIQLSKKKYLKNKFQNRVMN
jgi:hypothetical protein